MLDRGSGDGWWTERVNMDMQKPSKTRLGNKRCINAPVGCRSGHHCGVGRRGCGREGAANSSTDEKDEICVRKN